VQRRIAQTHNLVAFGSEYFPTLTGFTTISPESNSGSTTAFIAASRSPSLYHDLSEGLRVECPLRRGLDVPSADRFAVFPRTWPVIHSENTPSSSSDRSDKLHATPSVLSEADERSRKA
jgi:hypothetical protein